MSDREQSRAATKNHQPLPLHHTVRTVAAVLDAPAGPPCCSPARPACPGSMSNHKRSIKTPQATSHADGNEREAHQCRGAAAGWVGSGRTWSAAGLDYERSKPPIEKIIEKIIRKPPPLPRTSQIISLSRCRGRMAVRGPGGGERPGRAAIIKTSFSQKARQKSTSLPSSPVGNVAVMLLPVSRRPPLVNRGRDGRPAILL